MVPNAVEVGWVHDKDDIPRVPRDTSCHFVPGQMQVVVGGYLVYASPVFTYSAAAVGPAPTVAGTSPTSYADLVCIVCEFLEDAGVFSSSVDVKSSFEKSAYVRRCRAS